jgi:Fe2+ transport system protein FeoA
MAQADYNTTQPMPLSYARVGEVVYIHAVHAGRRLRRRLLDLGLVRGTCVRVMQRGMGGPVIVAVNQDSRLALGACMSQKIVVSRIPPTANIEEELTISACPNVHLYDEQEDVVLV